MEVTLILAVVGIAATLIAWLVPPPHQKKKPAVKRKNRQAIQSPKVSWRALAIVIRIHKQQK